MFIHKNLFELLQSYSNTEMIPLNSPGFHKQKKDHYCT